MTVMPLPEDISHKKIGLPYKFRSVEFFDQREKIDTVDLKTPEISFSKNLIVINPPLSSTQKDSIQKVLVKHMSEGIDTDVKVTIDEAYKEFSTLPMEDKEKARAFVRLKVEFINGNGSQKSIGGADYYVAVKDVNDKGFEQLYIITLKTAIHTAMRAIKN